MHLKFGKITKFNKYTLYGRREKTLDTELDCRPIGRRKPGQIFKRQLDGFKLEAETWFVLSA
jgi:hypothetical protein